MDPAPVEYRIEILSGAHDRSAFYSGVEALDSYIQRQAGQDSRKGVASVYISRTEQAGIVIGFYTLSSASIDLKDLPSETSNRLPRYPQVPATLLGRLAVQSAHKGRGLGEFLLLDALARSLQQSARIASAAVVVDAKDEVARRFYQRYGFMSLSDDPRRLFLPMKTVARLVSRRS